MKPTLIAFAALVFAQSLAPSLAAAEEAPFPPPLSACGAQALQSHVGGPLAALPPVAPPFSRREVCDLCAMTMDYVPQRQTVEYDEATRIIHAIGCG